MSAHLSVVRIRNYKSIGEATVELRPFTILVGPNGAGKSNFVEALAFVRDCLAESVELAFRNRGGIGAVRRKSAGHPTHIAIQLLINLEEQGALAEYGFEVAAKQKERFSIAWERCVVRPFLEEEHEFVVRSGSFSKAIPGIRPQVAPDRLALFAASATEEFRPVYDFLTSMRFHSIVPDQLRDLQEPDPGDFLKRDGSNAAAVLKRIRDLDPDRYQRLCSLLSKIVPGVSRVEYRDIGQRETLQFKQDVGLKHPWTFEALNMSDGTLRALGMMLAVYQPGRASVLVFEEPESTVHPAVMELIVQVLLDASRDRQIILTTHSPDVLDYEDIAEDQILVVTVEKNSTVIAPLAEVSRAAIRRRLYTPGELLRVGELEGDAGRAGELTKQTSLFDLEDHGTTTATPSDRSDS